MKKTLLICFLLVLVHQASSQEEGSEQTVGTIPSSEAGTVDINKLTKPRGRMRQGTMTPPNESSSYIGDPDNLDPLKANRDNLKDDDEPVLEDIRDVLNSDVKKKPTTPTQTASGDSSAANAEVPPPEVITETPVEAPAPEAPPAEAPVVEATPPVEEVPPPVVEAPPPAEPPPAVAGSGLSPDDPDLELEKKFHDIYKLYNINPTPDDIWAAATSKQNARLYEVQKGDTLWSISKILFGDPNFWPKLWAINKQGILNPHFINPKMKILFFEGNEESAPTLTVGDNAPAEAPIDLNAPVVVDADIPLTDEAPVPPPSAKQVADLAPVDDQFKVERKAAIKPIPIPPSLPESYNEKYYDSDKIKDVKISIDLGVQPEYAPVYVNDIVITDIPVKTDIEIKNSETLRMRCHPGRLLKEIVIKADELLTEYDMYEEMDGVDTVTGYKHSYKFVGTARSYQNKYLRVVSCNAFMSENLVILPKNKMKELSTQKISDVDEVKIIGGPDIRSQLFYSTLQYAFVDFGSQNYQIGQEFSTISNLTDQINATFKVIEKYGSYAVVVVTNQRDNLEIGDKVVLQ